MIRGSSTSGRPIRARRRPISILTAFILVAGLLASAAGPATAASPDSNGEPVDAQAAPHNYHADLVVESITITGNTLRVRVRNQGNDWALGFYVRSTQIGGSTEKWVTELVDGSAITLSFPIFCGPIGPPRGFVYADSQHDVVEWNEDNNTRFWSTGAPCRPGFNTPAG